MIAGLIFGALGLAVPLALVVYAGGAARAYFDQDRGGAPPVADDGLSDDVRALVVRAHDIRARIDEAIERADLPYGEVSAEVDKLVVTMEQTARRAQLLEEGLREAPPDAVFRRLEEVRSRAQPAQQDLVAALEYQLKVQRRMERQLDRFHDEMDRMLVELDTVRGNLISASASQDAYEQRRVAAGVRELRDDMGLVAKGVAEAYEDQEDLSATLARVSGDG